jgi:hypothetical protein
MSYTAVILSTSLAFFLYLITNILTRGLGRSPYGEPSARKPYATFDDFYEFYLSQHEQPRTKLLHFVGTFWAIMCCVIRPELGLSLCAGVAVGLAVFPLLRRFDSGLLEFALTIGTYVWCGMQLTESVSSVLVLPGVSYFFAWLSHFAIEKNVSAEQAGKRRRARQATRHSRAPTNAPPSPAPGDLHLPRLFSNWRFPHVCGGHLRVSSNNITVC